MGARERIGAREAANLSEAQRRVLAPVGYRPNTPFKAERIRDKELAPLIRIELADLRRLSAAGEVPSAAIFCSSYTYDIFMIRRWMRKGGHDRIRPKAPARQGKIYVIAAGKHVKIGFAADPARRLNSLQTASPVRLVTLAVFPGSTIDERRLHSRFANHRTSGEWFRREGDLTAWIEAGCPL